MSIRIRVVDGRTVALCAARSVPKPGDVYLDDTQHHALAEKFHEDYPELGVGLDAETVRLREQEESNNPNRDEWEKTWGGKQ